ncbi:M20 family metallopeptidase [Chitinimonas arctica]|uniref:M20 family metallopeptidase n=2 Tax=Chitinimonas arctica TaxID=2594795 RepID=A0A516SA95_9NEIS|nr:M20 family metallopeptidase [Chitinimonas arctica]
MLLTQAQAALGPVETALVKTVGQNSQEQLATLEKLVNINSGSTNPAGVIAVGEVLKPEFEALGFEVKWHALPAEMRHAGSLVATRPDGSGKKILLIGHLDTVFSPASRFQRFIRSGDKASGPGVIDDKGGVVTLLHALKALHAEGLLKRSNIVVVLTGDEEQSAKPTSISRKALMDAAEGAEVALEFEFSLADDSAVVARRGIGEWLLRSSGTSAHSSTIFSPKVGVGAVFELAHMLDTMRTQLADIPGLTFNPGLIMGGSELEEDAENGRGTVTGRKTVVAQTALAHGDLRFIDGAQMASTQARMRGIVANSLAGAHSTIEFKDGIPAMADTAANRALLQQYHEVSEALGYGPVRAVPPTARGAADISFVADKIKANLAGLGPAGTGAHTESETIWLDSLPKATSRAAILIYRLLQD